MSKWLDVGVFCGGACILVAGVGLYDAPAALIVFGGLAMATVIGTRLLGVRKS